MGLDGAQRQGQHVGDFLELELLDVLEQDQLATLIGELVERYASKTLAGIFPSGPPIDVEVRLEEFRFRGYQALAVLSFRVTREGQLVFERSYQGRGRRRLIQTDSAGSFELEQAVDLSTDEALRQVFGSFAREAREASGSW